MTEAEADLRCAGNLADAEALLAKADIAFLRGDHPKASSFYSAALNAALNQTQPGKVAREIPRIEAMLHWLVQRYRRWIMEHLDRAGYGRGQRHPRFQKALEILVGDREREPPQEQFPQEPTHFFYPDMPYVTFVNSERIGWKDALEASYPAIKEEVSQILETDRAGFQPYIRSAHGNFAQGDVMGLRDNHSWTSFFLWEKGAAVAANVDRCPTLFKTLLDTAPLCHVGERSPTVFLSMLRPGAHIQPHTGQLNFRYIAHLPLIIPAGCGLRVGDEVRNWREGELVMFDDTVEHEAWNKGDSDRLVLLFDVWRPEITEDEQKQIVTLFEAVDQYFAQSQH